MLCTHHPANQTMQRIIRNFVTCMGNGYMEYKTRTLAFVHSFSELAGGEVRIVVHSPFYNVIIDLINMLLSIFLCLTSILVSTATVGKTRSSSTLPIFCLTLFTLHFNFIVSPCLFGLFCKKKEEERLNY